MVPQKCSIIFEQFFSQWKVAAISKEEEKTLNEGL